MSRLTMPSVDKCLISLNPANGNALGFVEATAIEEIPHRVQQASNAQANWSSLPPVERAQLVEQAATALLANAPGMAARLSEETGKPRQLGLREVQQAARGVAATAKLAPRALESRHQCRTDTATHHRDPLGVCAIITPWDNPVALIHGMMIPALLAGNTVLWKPSPEVPLVCQQMAEIYQRFLPENVLQIVQGKESQGRALVAANVQLVAFSGSSKTGKHIMASAAFGLKRLLLAMGGKNIAIVLADADLDAAAKYAVDSSLGHYPRCIATERVFVDSRVANEFEYKVAALSQGCRIGAWDDPNANLGPIISVAKRQQVLNLVSNALDKGAVALAGGSNHPEFFVRPTVLSLVNNDMNIAHQEIPGPVLCISHFTYPREAIALANRSCFAQGAVVFGNETRATAIGRQLGAGVVAINRGLPCGELPWFGAGYSGFGSGPGLDRYQPFTQSRISLR